ncbi:PAS domain-containing sensor histidine kinase [Paenisporosarcina sp. TG20]|uniref:sensor histidine kinase n=1 Tax=Paenisporosarcina sp. TG20 TaxID=1211706 RepID=UPI0002FFD3F6|nr:PAS domain-containing sensor histidine kinase [Paenisporosarcina sp. TG20]
MKNKLKTLYSDLSEPIRSSITKKYVILFALTFIIPSLLIYQLIVGYAERMIENDIIETNVSNTDSIVKRINKEVSDIVLQLHLISGNVIDNELDVDIIFERSKIAISQSPIVHTIYFLNENQKMIFEAPFEPEIEPSIYYDYPKFERVKRSLNYAVSDFAPNSRGDTVVSVAIPVLNKKHEFKGVLIAELGKDYLSSVLKSFIGTKGHFSFIVDNHGKVLSSTNGKEVGLDYSSELIVKKLFQDSFGVMKETYLDEKSVIAYQTMRDGWALAYGVPESIAFEPIRKLSFLFTISFLGVFALSILFIWMGMRNIVYPIVRLTNYAKEYRKKMYYESTDSHQCYQNDELGVLRKTIISVGNSNYQKQKMLEEKERYLHDVIEGIPYAIVTVNKDAMITYVNQQFEKMVGFSRNKLLDVTLSELPIKNDKNDFRLLHSLVSKETSSECESYIINADGQKHIVKIATAKLYNEQKEAIGSIAVLQDISQMKLLESRLKQNDKLAIIGQITTGIAHEIKNPLAILSGSAELLVDEVEEENSSSEIVELSKDIHQVVRRMNSIVNNFLSFAKINKKDAESFDVSMVMEEVLHLVRLKTSESRIEVIRQYEPTSEIIGLHDQLIQAFLNLVLNAIEAMPIEGTLTVSTFEVIQAKQGRCVIVAIDDTGPGIPEKDVEWLFDPFFSTKETGNGLGLTIARDIVREHNGELKIESSSEGTSFQCCFLVNTGVEVENE